MADLGPASGLRELIIKSGAIVFVRGPQSTNDQMTVIQARQIAPAFNIDRSGDQAGTQSGSSGSSSGTTGSSSSGRTGSSNSGVSRD